MPLYEDRHNAENKIQVPETVAGALIVGSTAVVDEMLRAIQQRAAELGRPVAVAFDGWYGIDWSGILEQIRDADRTHTVGAYVAMSDCVIDHDALYSGSGPFGRCVAAALSGRLGKPDPF